VTTNFVGFIGFYQQSWVCVAFGRWRRTTRSAIAALGQLTDQLTATSGRWGDSRAGYRQALPCIK